MEDLDNNLLYYGSLLSMGYDIFSLGWWANIALSPLLLLAFGLFYKTMFAKPLAKLFKKLKEHIKKHHLAIKNRLKYGNGKRNDGE